MLNIASQYDLEGIICVLCHGQRHGEGLGGGGVEDRRERLGVRDFHGKVAQGDFCGNVFKPAGPGTQGRPEG